jgi:hypothetical protein
MEKEDQRFIVKDFCMKGWYLKQIREELSPKSKSSRRSSEKVNYRGVTFAPKKDVNDRWQATSDR